METGDLAFLDNGVPAQTAAAASGNYAMVGSVPIKNASRQTLDTAALADGGFSAALSEQAPQVLIVHTHGSEAYTMPAGEEYAATGSFRTDDATRSVVRVGDEIAAVLSSYGISVLHDRTLHDSPSYNGAYARSLTSIEGYLEKYPSLSFVLDVHRDAVQDASGQQYKLVSREEPHAAQISLVMGSDHDRWQDNLRLAVAVEERLMQSYPTLMRPITLRNYSYNQSVCPGSMLVEVGAAGNSLDEAIYAARLFAAGPRRSRRRLRAEALDEPVGDACRQPPERVRQTAVDGHLHLRALPAVVRRDARRVIGEALDPDGVKPVAVYLRRMGAQPVDRDEERIAHLGGAAAHVPERRGVHPREHRMHQALRAQIEKVQLAEHGDVLRRNGQLFPRLAQGALYRRLAGLHPPAGEAHLRRVVAQVLRPHLIEQVQPVGPLDQRDEDGEFRPRLLQRRAVSA